MAFNMEKHQTGVFFILLCTLCFSAVRSMMLIELDDSFPDRRKDTAWLVMFYAPWCGHCKKLEPTFYQVAMDLDGTEIRVGKLDATQYASVASLYDVRGYPTIKFLRGDTDFTHKSDRSRNGIVQFAKRAYGPQIRRLSNQGRLYDTRSEHSDGVFFLYIGDHDEHADLMIKYKDVAEKYAVSGYFYAGDRNVLPINIIPTQYPTIYVYKDGHHFEIQHPEEGITKSHLEEFFIHEQFTQFPKIESGGGLNDFAILPKKLVIVVVEEYEQNETLKFHGDRAKSISEFLAKQNRDTYHGDFQFAWMGDLETARSLTMSHMAAPNLFVLDPSNHYYYLPSFDTIGMTQNDLVEFLADVQDGKMPAYGGTGIVQGVKRFFYDIVVTVYLEIADLYRTAGWLTFVIFGVPALVISIVCYAMCCMEPFDDSIFEREYWVEQERLAKLAAEGKLDENGEEIIDDDEKKRLLDDAEAGPEEGAEGESPPPPPPLEPCADADGHMKKD